METISTILSSGNVWVLIPLVAIVMGIGKTMLNRYFEHQERMAEIEAGVLRNDEDS